MGDLTLFTCDWVAEPPRGYARDIRLRWARSVAVEWLFAALNSVEMASLPWALFKFTGNASDTPGWKFLDDFLKLRLKHMEAALAGREWLARLLDAVPDGRAVPERARALYCTAFLVS